MNKYINMFLDALDDANLDNMLDTQNENYNRICDIVAMIMNGTYSDVEIEELVELSKTISPKLYKKALILDNIL